MGGGSIGRWDTSSRDVHEPSCVCVPVKVEMFHEQSGMLESRSFLEIADLKKHSSRNWRVIVVTRQMLCLCCGPRMVFQHLT